MNIVQTKALSVRYAQTLALNNITLAIPQASRTAIIGPNGAGKSTLIKAILGLIPSEHQSILIFNQPIDKVRQRIAYVPQTSQVNWHFPATVLDVVLMAISTKRFAFQRITEEQRNIALSALETMELLDLQDRQISQLSGGQKQRVFLARSMAQNAELYVLDEPLAGVDMKSEQIIMDQLMHFQQLGKTSITVHHDLNTVPEYFDHVVILNKDLIVSGPVESVFTDEWIAKAYGPKKGGVRYDF